MSNQHRLDPTHDATAWLAAIVESSNDAIIGKTLSGTITSWNPGAERIFGYTAAEAIGQPMLMLFPPDRTDEEAGILKRIGRGERVRDFETVRVRKDGLHIHVSVSISPIADANGHIVGASKIARDVSAQRLVADRLTLNLSLLRMAGTIARLGGWSIELPSGKGTWSDELRTIHGVPPGYTPTIEESMAFFAPEYRDPMARDLEACLHHGTSFDRELQIVTASGTRLWVRAIGEAVRDSAGTIVRAQGAVQDISQRMRAEDALRERERELRELAESMPQMVWMTRPDGKNIYFNRRWVDYTGLSLQESYGDGWSKPFHPEDRPRALHAWQQALAGEAEYGLECRLRASDGNYRWMMIRGIPLRDEAGHIHKWAGTCTDIDDLKRAGDTARQNEAQQRQLAVDLELERARLVAAQAVARVGSWETDLASLEVTWSLETHRIFGTTPNTFQPTHPRFLGMVHPDDRALVEASFLQAPPDGAFSTIEHRIMTPDGETKVVEERWQLFGDDFGRPVRAVGTCQDISERKAAAEQVRALGDRLLDTMESITDAFFTVDREGVITYLNAEAEHLFERPRSELPGRPLSDELRLAAGSNWLREYQDARPGKVAAAFEEFHPRLDKWFDVRVFPARDGLAAHFRDITELKKGREALRANEERLQLFSTASHEAIWDWDLAANTLWWSEGFETLFGHARDPAGSGIETWTRRIHPDERDRVVADIYQAIEGAGNFWTATYRFLRHDGSYARVLDRGLVIRAGSAQATRMVGGMADISEQSALEERLRQSQRLESVGQLTGGVAHDFNNLLTVVLGNAELLAEECQADTRLHMLAETILGAAQRGADLTQRLLAFARQQALDPQVVDLNHLVEELGRLLRRTLGEHIEIDFKPDAAVWPARVDPAQLESALLNLCLNARDAMPHGGRLTVETSCVRIDPDYAAGHDDIPPGEYVMLAVSDTGSGIPPDLLARVFEPFFTTKEKGKGTGLGLAMVYGFVKQSEGHVSIYSEPGHGTTVKMYFKRASGRARNPVLQSGSRDLPHGTETILMVEDDDFVRRYAQNQLNALGYTVLVAENGAQALDLMQRHDTIDLLFTDVVMPGIGGRELVKKARELRPGLKVLYTSGYTENAILHHGRLDSGGLLLGKPYRRLDLARKIREALAEG